MALILAAGVLARPLPSAARPELTGEDAVAAALLFGRPMPPPEITSSLPAAIQGRIAEYRRREAAFRSALTPPPGATPDEQRSFEQRVGIERVVFCLFPRRDSARIASLYALDVDVSFDWEGAPARPRGEAAFIDRLLSDLPQPWLAPYLNLIAAHRRLCASELETAAPDRERGAWLRDAERQLALAQDRGSPLIRFVAEFVATAARPCSPSL